MMLNSKVDRVVFWQVIWIFEMKIINHEISRCKNMKLRPDMHACDASFDATDYLSLFNATFDAAYIMNRKPFNKR